MILKKKEITLLLDFRENLLREKEQDILHISYLKKINTPQTVLRKKHIANNNNNNNNTTNNKNNIEFSFMTHAQRS